MSFSFCHSVLDTESIKIIIGIDSRWSLPRCEAGGNDMEIVS